MAAPEMTPERWKQISTLLDEALELPPEQVASFLDEACAGDAELRRQVEELLAAHGEADGFLKTPIGDVAPMVDEVRRMQMPESIGPYRIERELGHGGMGVVYQALDTRLERPVAIKILPVGLTGGTARDRFVHEARAASALDHANICSIYDIGETEDGRLYIVMAYYAGETLFTRLQEGPLPVDEARDLALQIARGLERAHQAGIVHRDVKPGNIALTQHGEAKILDFGIAKVVDRTALTMTGTAPGTPAYMSPEQARGEPVDARTDIFSLGVMLYEMLCGERPFRADNPQAMIYSILHSDPEPLEIRRPEVPVELRRIVMKAMAKKPGRRYADMREMITDLKESGTTATVLLSSVVSLVSRVRYRARRAAVAWAAVAVLAAGLAGWWWLGRGGEPSADGSPAGIELPAPSAPVKARRTFLAVLPFRNSTGAPGLDWMSESFSEMLSMELSQSPDIQVLSYTRLARLLDEHAKEGTREALIRDLAAQEKVRVVLIGSYVYLGDTLRVDFSLEDVDGTVLAAASQEGLGEEALFSLVDGLSAAVRNRFEIVRTPAEPAAIRMVTTASLEAWRLYTEGLTLFRASKFEEAIPLLEKAIEIDPGFALALSNLAQLYRNLSNEEKVREYSRRAVEQADRLPVDYRYLVEGNYYKESWATYDRALEVFRQGLRLYPDNPTFQRQVPQLYAYLERYEEARESYESLLQQGDLPAGASYAAASVYTALGFEGPAERLLLDLNRRVPDSWAAKAFLAKHYLFWGRLEKAEEQLQRAFRERPGEAYLLGTSWYLQVLREDWGQAASEARALEDANRWQAAVSSALTSTFRGRSQEALELFAQAGEASTGARAAQAHCWSAELRLARGEEAEALREAQLAQELGRDQWPELWALFLTALAADRQGDSSTADTAQTALREKLQRRPNRFEERQLYRLTGLRAGLRGDLEGAVASLRRAESLLPPRGVAMPPFVLPDHVPIWVELGEAELVAGHDEEAQKWLLKATQSGMEHTDSPYAWVRSFLWLGRLHQKQGDLAAAKPYFERFLALWKDGDLDRAWIAVAAQAIDSAAESNDQP